MAKKGTPVKRVVMSKEGLSHVVSEVPGPDYPDMNPYLVKHGEEEEEDGDGLPPERFFDGTSLLPGSHVGGGAGYLPGGVLPPTVGGVGGVGAGAGAGGGEMDADAGEDATAGDEASSG